MLLELLRSKAFEEYMDEVERVDAAPSAVAKVWAVANAAARELALGKPDIKRAFDTYWDEVSGAPGVAGDRGGVG